MASVGFGILAIVLTALAAFNEARKANASRKHLLMLLGATLATLASTIWAWSEQSTFEKWVLGGDGYAYVTFADPADPTSRLMVRNSSDEYPVYDVSVEFYDVRQFDGKSIRDYERLIQIIDRSVMAPGKVIFAVNQYPPPDCYGVWGALSSQRGRDVLNVIQARKIAGKWETSTRVYTADPHLELLNEFPSPGWDRETAWPVVTYKWPVRFAYQYAIVPCAPQ